VLGSLAGALTIVVAAVAAGCSADVTRFSLGGFTLGGFASTDAAPVPPASANRPKYSLAPDEAALPPIAPQKDYRVIGRDYDRPPGRPPAAAPIAPAFKPPAPAQAPGDTIVEVQPGDTLYSIARRYGVTASAIKELNDLPTAAVRPGQRLVVPGRGMDHDPPQKDHNPLQKANPPSGESTGAKHPTATVTPPPQGWEGRYIVKRGDSLSRIALQHKVSVAELKRVNGIADPTKVWAGTALLVPGGSEPAADPAPALPPRVVQVKPLIIKGTTEETEEPEAARPPKTARHDIETGTVPPRAVASGKFRWPVRGRVIVGFGKQADGTKNEGINLAAPLGTDVHAAEAGRVHYVGDGLKGYGNLVLIRHANDWATAYAHVGRILVKPNDQVRRGQVIAKVGKSGPVAQPQLKFELRKDSIPVNPLAHLAN
jgi:murein DD-endopeptidase MepM/ murein hydrolase activator NlpD